MESEGNMVDLFAVALLEEEERRLAENTGSTWDEVCGEHSDAFVRNGFDLVEFCWQRCDRLR